MKVEYFDWDKHWMRKEEPRDSKVFAETMAQRIIDFMDGKKIESMADFGCGPASMLFVLAEKRPGIQLHGYDVSDSIIKKNMAKTRELGLTGSRQIVIRRGQRRRVARIQLPEQADEEPDEERDRSF